MVLEGGGRHEDRDGAPVLGNRHRLALRLIEQGKKLVFASAAGIVSIAILLLILIIVTKFLVYQQF
jgi:hypothetical protein